MSTTDPADRPTQRGTERQTHGEVDRPPQGEPDHQTPDEVTSVALGRVHRPDGDLAGAELHGEPLEVHATRELTAAGIRVAGPAEGWADLRRRGLPVVLHDARCPLTPAGFLAGAARLAREGDAVVVCVRPVTDTIKTVADGVVGETVDRDGLWTVVSPVVLPASVVAALSEEPALDRPAAAVERLRARFPLRVLEAPALARRVEDRSAVLLLEAFEELHPGPGGD